MCFRRKPSLGHYNSSRAEWKADYRSARLAAGRGEEPDAALTGTAWKAALIVSYERDSFNDHLTIPVGNRLETKRIIDELLKSETTV